MQRSIDNNTNEQQCTNNSVAESNRNISRKIVTCVILPLLLAIFVILASCKLDQPRPNVEYASEKGLSAYTNQIEPFDLDGAMDEKERAVIEIAYKISQQNISQELKDKNISYVLSSKGADIKNAYNFLESFSGKVLKDMLEFGFGDDVIEYVSLLSSLSDKDFVKYALENMLCIQDRALSDIERRFLEDPSNYGEQLRDYYLSQVSDARFLTELRRQPDLLGSDIKQAELAEDAAELAQYKYLGGEGGISFDEIYTIGIQDKIAYNSVVQAALWFLIDKEPKDLDERPWGRPQLDSPIPSFLMYVWANSSESKNYESERWSWKEGKERLNAPIPIAAFFKGVKIYDLEKLKRADPYQQSPKENYTTKKGICNDQARNALYLLLENGWEFTTDFEADRNKPVAAAVVSQQYFPKGHVECICTDPPRGEGFYAIGSSPYNHGYIKGPFSTAEEVFNSIYFNPRVFRIIDVSGQAFKEWRN
ncbi:hypothetical protein ACFLTN_07740 [Chloroflexota bacterium]